MAGIYPISLLVGSMGLNLTIVSRHDNVDFGIIACRKTVPHAQHLLGYLEDALCELESQVPGATTPGKKAVKAKVRANRPKKRAPRKAPGKSPGTKAAGKKNAVKKKA